MRMLKRNTDPKTGKPHFVQACAGERHTDISQELFCVGVYRENAKR